MITQSTGRTSLLPTIQSGKRMDSRRTKDLIPSNLARVQQSLPAIVSTITPLQRAFNKLPIEFSQAFDAPFIARVQSIVGNYLVNPHLELPFQRNPEDTIHEFRYANKIVIYLKEGVAVGSGSSKKVCTAWRLRATNQPHNPDIRCLRVARTDLNSFPTEDQECILKSVEEEATIHSNLYHPNICLLYNWQRYSLSGAKEAKKDNVTMYIELYPRALHKLLSEKNITLEFFWRLAEHLLSALNYLHSYQVDGRAYKLVHTDIKPANIVCNGRTFALIDFGLINSKRGTLAYMPLNYIDPNVLKNSEHDDIKDLWAAGCTLYVTYLAAILKDVPPTYLLFPPWGIVLNFYDQIDSILADLEKIQRNHPYSHEEVKAPLTTSSEVSIALQEAAEIVKEISKLTFSNWTSIFPSDYSPFHTILLLTKKFDSVAKLTKDIQKMPEAHTYELPALIRYCKAMLEALAIHAERLSQILDEIPRPTHNAELIIWHLLTSKKGFAIKQISAHFLTATFAQKTRAPIPTTEIIVA